MKYRFQYIYQNKNLQKVSDFLKKCDLGDRQFGFKETIEFTSKNDIPIPILKETLKEAFEFADCTLLYIEGGKIE